MHAPRRPSRSPSLTAADARCKGHACAVAGYSGCVNRCSNRAQAARGTQARPGELREEPRALNARTRLSTRGRSCAWQATAAGAAHLSRGQDTPCCLAQAACARPGPHLRCAARLRATLLGARSARGCVPPLAGPVRRARLALPQRSIALPTDVAVLRQHVPPAKRPLKCALLQCALDVPLEATPWSSHCAVQHLRGTPSIYYSAHCEAQHFRDTGSGHLRAHFSSAALESHLQAPRQCPRFKCATQVPPRVRQVRATRCSLQVPLPLSLYWSS